MKTQWRPFMEDLISNLLISSSSFSLIDLFLALLVPFLLTFIITETYKRVQWEYTYSLSFIHALFLFAIVGSFMTLIIGENLARAFGLVGALSIIRFRTAVKSTMDSIFMLWTLGVGLACGTQNYFAALILVVFGSLTLLALKKLRYAETQDYNGFLKIEYTPPLEEKVNGIIQKHFKNIRKIQSDFNDENKVTTFIFRESKNFEPFASKKELSAIEGIKSVKLINDNAAPFL